MKFKDFLLNEKFRAADRIKQRFGDYSDPTAYINVHMNPNHDEVLEVIKNFKETDPEQYKKTGEMDFVRGFFDKKTGDLYVWYGTFFHDNVGNFIQRHDGGTNFQKNNNFRFAWLKGDNHLTVEGHLAKSYFDDYKNDKLKTKMVKELFNAFPMIKEKGENETLYPRVKQGTDAWVPSIKGGDKDKKDSPETPEEKKQQKILAKTEDLAKVGDTIVFSQNTPGMAGEKVKILAVLANFKKYHYVFKSPKNSPTKHPAEKILKANHIHFIDGKENITKANEPFSSQLSTGDYIKEIIPNPDRIKKPNSNNLYTPRRDDDKETYRAYTDRRE